MLYFFSQCPITPATHPSQGELRGPDLARGDLMKIPKDLQPLVDDGVIDEVVRSLKSGKEATVYLVRSGMHLRCAKV